MTHTTFIHSSDLQIGMTRKFLSPEAQARFDESRERSIDALGNLARDRGAEFIVIAGDVFEHNSLEERTLGRALEALRRLPVPVFSRVTTIRSLRIQFLAARRTSRTSPSSRPRSRSRRWTGSTSSARRC